MRPPANPATPVRRVLSLLGLLMAAATSTPAPAAPSDRMWSDTPAKRWEHALVAGNGVQSLMVHGDPAHERLIFGHERFYEPRRSTPALAPDIAAHLPRVRELQAAGRFKEAADFYWQKCNEAGHDAIQWTEPFHPGFALTIEQDGAQAADAAAGYRRACDFTTGELSVSWTGDAGGYARRGFVSRSDNVIVVELRGRNGAAPLACTLNLESQGLKAYKPEDADNPKSLDGVLTPQITVGQGWLSYRLGYKQTRGGYEGFTRVVVDGGTQDVTPEGLRIAGARRVLLLTRLVPLEDFAVSQAVAVKAALVALPADYDTLLKPHAAEHGAMYRRVALDLGGSAADHALSNEALIARQKTLAAAAEGAIDLALLEKVFNMGRYTLISSSGALPPNLQGLWNGRFQPAWSGDFTLDANLNLQIAGASMAGLPEAIDSYTALMEGMRPDWQTNAARLYGSSGLMAPPRTSGVDGHNYHLSPNFPSGAWTAGGQWLVLPMIEAYQTTGDRDYLVNSVMPFVEGLAQFYVDFLVVEDDGGRLVFSPSYSPEHAPQGHPTMVANATMDVAAGKEALRYAVRFSEQLGTNADRVPVWRALLDKMPDYRINDDGALAEWIPPAMGDRYDHRHVSHLYPLWPGHEINPDDTPELFRAAVVAAEKRGRGNGSAHGLSHMALIATRLKQSTLVAGNLSFILSNNYLTRGLFTYHNPGWLFNADALHSLPAVVMEMLVYSRPGEIELLPALDTTFARGTIRGLRTRSQVTVEDLTWDLGAGELTVRLRPLTPQTVTLRLRHGIRTATVDGGPPLEPVGSDALRLELEDDTPVTVRITF